MDCKPASGSGKSPTRPSPTSYHKRSLSTSCLDLEKMGLPDIHPFTPGHRRSASDPPTSIINVAPYTDQDDAPKINPETASHKDRGLAELRRDARIDLLRQRMEYLETIKMLMIQLNTTRFAYDRNFEVLKRLTVQYHEMKKQRDMLLYILNKINKGKWKL